MQPDMVIHARRDIGADVGSGGAIAPRVGLIIPKSVGSAVERHRVARRLRHVMRGLLAELDRRDQLVIRARPSSRHAPSVTLEAQLRAGLRRVHESLGLKW